MQLEALEKIDFLIFKNDLLGLLDLIKSNDNLQVLYKNGQKFLTNCYKYQSFDIAAFLLSKNIKFDIRNLLYNNLTSKNAPKYIEHLFNIKPFIDLDDFDNLLSLFSAVMKVESHNKKELSKGCLNVVDVLVSITYVSNSNRKDEIRAMYNNLYQSSSQIIKDILLTVAASNYKDGLLKIYMPDSVDGSHLQAAHASNNQIYFPITFLDIYEQSLFVHEFGHYAIERLFNNSGAPYKQNNQTMYDAYIKAAKAILLEIPIVYKATFSKEVKSSVFNNMSVIKLSKLIADNFKFHIFSINNYNKDNPLIFKIADAYFGNVTVTTNDQKISFLDLYLANVKAEYNIDNVLGYFLSRLSEFSLRPENEYDAELMVRKAEFDLVPSNKLIQQIWSPLDVYWIDYVHPEVESLKSLIPECKNLHTTSLSINGELEVSSSALDI